MNLRVTIYSIFFILKLIIRLPGMLISYYVKRRRAVGQFRRELVAQGVPQDEAKELGNLYPFKLSEILTLTRGLSRS